jgi:hypothetical protein
MVQVKVQGKDLYKPPNHGRMVKMAEVGVQGICPIIDLIIAKLKECSQKTTNGCRKDQQQDKDFSNILIR